MQKSLSMLFLIFILLTSLCYSLQSNHKTYYYTTDLSLSFITSQMENFLDQGKNQSEQAWHTAINDAISLQKRNHNALSIAALLGNLKKTLRSRINKISALTADPTVDHEALSSAKAFGCVTTGIGLLTALVYKFGYQPNSQSYCQLKDDLEKDGTEIKYGLYRRLSEVTLVYTKTPPGADIMKQLKNILEKDQFFGGVIVAGVVALMVSLLITSGSVLDSFNKDKIAKYLEQESKYLSKYQDLLLFVEQCEMKLQI